MEELEEELKTLKGVRTPREDQQSQLTWTPGALRDGAINQRADMGWTKAMAQNSKCVAQYPQVPGLLLVGENVLSGRD